MLWELRPPTEDDVAFIYSSWLKTHRQSTANVDIGNTVYYAEMHANIEAVIRGDKTHLVVACSPNEGDSAIIFGYGVAELLSDDELCIHMIYGKHPFRNFGLGRAIEAELLKLPHTKVSYSCHTKLAKSLNRKRNYVFNPWRLWSKKK